MRWRAKCERLGADGILSVTPYYNKPTQEGLYHHYKAIASAISLPIILYNVPPRTNVNIDPATVRQLSEIENIIGVKEASGSISQITQVIQHVPEDFHRVFGRRRDHASACRHGRPRNYFRRVERNSRGDDAAGATVPCGRFRRGARHAAQMAAAARSELHRDESHVPVKAAMAEMGLLEPVFRLPLVPPRAENLAKIRTVLESLALLERAHVANRS